MQKALKVFSFVFALLITLSLTTPAHAQLRENPTPTLTAQEAMQIRNSEQRMVAIRYLRPDRLLKQLNAKLIHTGIKRTKLYEVPNFMDTGEAEYCMFMVDGSTPREFVEWVPPEIGKQADADLAQAHAWGLPKEDYLTLEQEA